MDIVDLICQAEIPGDVVLSVGRDSLNHLVLESRKYDQRVSRFINDPRGQHCRVCGRGWDLTPMSFCDQIEDPHDRGRILHLRCMKGVIAYNQRKRFEDALIKAKLRFTYLIEVKNEYGGAWNEPWYEARLNEPLGVTIKLGCRKRVDHVEVIGAKVGNIFADQKSTNGETDNGAYVHAWDDEQLNLCVAKIAQVLRAVE